MKNSLVTILVVLFFLSAALAQRQTSIKQASVYRHDGITFSSPNQPGWVLLKSDKLGALFEKQDTDAVSNANVKIIKTKTFETDEERLTGFEALKKEDLSRLNRDSIHFNYVRFKSSKCLQYDGIFKLDDASAPKFKYFNVKGYLLPHPKARDLAVQIEFSNRSGTRGFTEDLISLSDEFFAKLYFPKRR